MHFWGLFGSEYVVPTDHESLLDVLSNHSYNFEKTSAFRRYAIRFFGDGLVSQEQNVHKENRKTYTPVFNQKAIYDVRHMISSKSTEFVDRISELCNANTAKSAVVPFSEFVSLVSLDIVSNVALGIDFETIRGKNRHIFDAYETIFPSTHHKKWRFLWHNIIPPWLDRLIPSAEESQMDKAHDLLVHIIRDSIPKRLTDVEKDETHNTDFLSNLVKSGKFNEEEHMAQLVTILAAGYESTGGSLSFVIYCLAAHRDAQEILRKEITKAKNGRKALDEDEYDRLPYLNAMVMESLRLYPSFPLLLRKAIRDTTIKGRFIPKGTYIGVSPRAINYAKHIWGPDADQFNPERWLDRSDPKTPKPIPSGAALAETWPLHKLSAKLL
ncbi:cytochrome P450 [Aspergillus terreus]|uniref:Cytochrome P450 n=1 Tax=Aspergillus terreus TaxID=33178 RepID=A0A5M3YWS4_ASPTE|nr:hypothetical protein ATETN484_0003074800 [Aspergillus terreus]GFF14734.1 cytochrome P450 [Aspergillus terreus]